MDVSLPLPLQEYVRRMVEDGQFSSVDAVVCEGLLLLQRREQWKSDARAKIDIGWEQANSGQLLAPEQVQENLVARKAAWVPGGK